MNEAASQEMPIWVVILIPLAFFIVFPMMWCFVMWINSHVGGWSRLARRYRVAEEPQGRVWNGQQGGVGLVSYRGVLRCVTNDEGLFMRPGLLFRFAHPGLFIPWSEMSEVRRRDILWLRMVAAKVGNPKVATISLPSDVFENSAGKELIS